MDIVLEVAVGRKPENVTIALGGLGRLFPNTYVAHARVSGVVVVGILVVG
jgi:hypothetical protein